MLELKLWQEILLWAIIFIDLFIFVKLSQLDINGFPLIKLHWRILIAVLFPLIFVIALMFSAVLVAIVLIILFILFLFFLFGKKFNFRIRIF